MPSTRHFFALIFLGSFSFFAHAGSFQKNEQGVLVQVGSAHVEISAANATAFRLSISYNGKVEPSESTFLEKFETPKWKFIQSGKFVGVQTSAGELEIDPDSGQWLLKDAKGALLTSPSSLEELNDTVAEDHSKRTGIDLTVARKSGAPLQLYGCGNGAVSLLQTKAETRVGNGTAVIPYYWST